MKIHELDTMVVQKTINILLDNGYSVDVAKKIKHIINQFCEYAIDSKWMIINPTVKVKIRAREKKATGNEHYKALPPEERNRFINASMMIRPIF